MMTMMMMTAAMFLALLVAALSIATQVASRPSEDTIRYQVQEELPAGTRVGNIVSDAGLRRRFPKNVVSMLEYRFLSEPPIPLVIGLTDGKKVKKTAKRQLDESGNRREGKVPTVTYFMSLS